MCSGAKMRIAGWDIYAGFPYRRLLEDWEDFDEAMKRARPSWDVIGIHMWHEITDEAHMLEVRFVRKHLRLRASPKYTHLPAYWVVDTCNCSDCKALKDETEA